MERLLTDKEIELLEARGVNTEDPEAVRKEMDLIYEETLDEY